MTTITRTAQPVVEQTTPEVPWAANGHRSRPHPVVADAPFPLPGAVGPRPVRHVTSVTHQGIVVAFARDADGADVYYNVLDLQVGSAADAVEWTGFSKLTFPHELRSAGLGIVSIEDPKGKLLHAADAPLKAVSDGQYICLFQQSSAGTLLLNRFMLKRVAPRGGAPAPVLEPIWEVRFQRSGKQDVPDGPRDSQSYLSPDGAPFIEPTIELPMIHDLDGGTFHAMVLPAETSTARTWQFFAVNSATTTLDLFAFPMSDSGLFDLRGKEVGADGVVAPDASLTLTLDDTTPLALAGAPNATLYMLHERVRATSGDSLMLKRVARVLLAQPVKRAANADREVATLDFALSKDGRLAQIDGSTSVTTVSPADYGLSFADAAHLDVPDNGTLRLKGGFRAEFWMQLTTAPATERYVFGGDPAIDPGKQAPYVLVTPDLQLEVGFGDGTKTVAARTVGAAVSPAVWAHVEVAYDPTAKAGNFSVLVNCGAPPLSGADATSAPSGSPITRISGARDGIVGVLDFLRIWDTSDGGDKLVADWPFDSVDYDTTPPTTPDTSPAKNDAVVDAPCWLRRRRR